MTEDQYRTAAPRDVPPPRPVPSGPSAAPADEGGLGRAARAVADAVAGLLGDAGPRPDGTGDGRSAAGRSAASSLRDVLGAVAGAAAATLGRDRPPSTAEGVPPPTSESARESTRGDRTPGAVLGDLLAAAAPRLPIRDGDRIRRAYPGASQAEIAAALVGRAARLTSAIGAATGGLAASQWFAPASLLALPLELGAETVLVGAVEVVLIGELHELYGRPASGDARARAAAYLGGWSVRRSVDGARDIGLGSLIGSASLHELRRRVTRRFARALPTAAPFLLGAAIAGRGNRRATESLAERVLADLQGRRPVGS